MSDLKEFCIPSIRLTHGKGQPGKAACWMSAISVLLGKGWTDRNHECVEPAINSYCIFFNDYFGEGKAADEVRSQVILPILYEPMATRGDDETDRRRKFIWLDAAYRRWLPESLELLANCEDAKRLRNLHPIIDDRTVAAAATAVAAAATAATAATAVAAIAATAATAAAATIAAVATAAVVAATAAAPSRHQLSWPSRLLEAKRRFAERELVPTLRRMIEAGPHAAAEAIRPAVSSGEFLERIGAAQ
jgi:hypothetical protein